MWKFIEKIDVSLFYFINRGGQNEFFDLIMPIISNIKYFVLPIGLFWIFLILKKNAKTRLVAVIFFLLIGLSDWVNSSVLKPIFSRPRPYHDISNVHYYKKTWRITTKNEKIKSGKAKMCIIIKKPGVLLLKMKK
jgi:membrane-associated phospholipid phosphatase